MHGMSTICFIPIGLSLLHTRTGARFGKAESFLYSAFLSTAYEYGVEALFEQPSIQDLIVTPIAGSLLGWAVEPVRDRIKAKGPEQMWYDKFFLVMTDPLGAINSVFDRLLGIDGSVSIKSGGRNHVQRVTAEARARRGRGGTCARLIKASS